MKTEATNVITWNELVFSNRNKAYGAFLLRKLYHDHLSFAFAISTLLVLLWAGGSRLLISLSIQKDAFVPQLKKDGGLIPPPIVQRIIEATQAAPQQKSINKDVFVATTKNVEDVPVTKTEITPLTTGTEQGTVDANFTSTTAVATTTVSLPVVKAPDIYITAEVMPVYEGGTEAMIKFLSKKIKYPPAARRNHTEGTVYIQFVINAAGLVTDVQVIKGISAECDAEAMRVVALMNKWKAGLQHGVPVSVRMVLPIKFKMD